MECKISTRWLANDVVQAELEVFCGLAAWLFVMPAVEVFWFFELVLRAPTLGPAERGCRGPALARVGGRAPAPPCADEAGPPCPPAAPARGSSRPRGTPRRSADGGRRAPCPAESAPRRRATSCSTSCARTRRRSSRRRRRRSGPASPNPLTRQALAAEAEPTPATYSDSNLTVVKAGREDGRDRVSVSDRQTPTRNLFCFRAFGTQIV